MLERNVGNCGERFWAVGPVRTRIPKALRCKDLDDLPRYRQVDLRESNVSTPTTLVNLAMLVPRKNVTPAAKKLPYSPERDHRCRKRKPDNYMCNVRIACANSVRHCSIQHSEYDSKVVVNDKQIAHPIPKRPERQTKKRIRNELGQRSRLVPFQRKILHSRKDPNQNRRK